MGKLEKHGKPRDNLESIQRCFKLEIVSRMGTITPKPRPFNGKELH